MKIRKNNIELVDTLYSMILFLMVFVGFSTLNRDISINHYYRLYFRIITVIVIIFCLFLKKFSIKEIAWYGGTFTLILISFFFNSTINFLNIWALNMLLKDKEIDWILKKSFNVLLMGFLAVIIFNLFQMIPSYYSLSGGIERNSLGFRHPNTTGGLYLIICMCHILIKKKEIKIKSLVLMMIVGTGLNFIIDSRSSFYLLIFMCFLIILLKNRLFEHEKIRRKILKASNFLYLCAFLFSYFSARYFDLSNRYFRSLDRLLSNRLRLSQIFINRYPINAFGSRLQFTIGQGVTFEEYELLDNGYLRLLLESGLLFTILMFFYYRWINKRMTESGFALFPIISSVFFMYGITEWFFLSLPFNIFVLLGGSLFLRKQEIHKNVKNRNVERNVGVF